MEKNRSVIAWRTMQLTFIRQHSALIICFMRLQAISRSYQLPGSTRTSLVTLGCVELGLGAVILIKIASMVPAPFPLRFRFYYWEFVAISGNPLANGWWYYSIIIKSLLLNIWHKISSLLLAKIAIPKLCFQVTTIFFSTCSVVMKKKVVCL